MRMAKTRKRVREKRKNLEGKTPSAKGSDKV